MSKHDDATDQLLVAIDVAAKRAKELLEAPLDGGAYADAQQAAIVAERRARAYAVLTVPHAPNPLVRVQS